MFHNLLAEMQYRIAAFTQPHPFFLWSKVSSLRAHIPTLRLNPNPARRLAFLGRVECGCGRMDLTGCPAHGMIYTVRVLSVI